MGVEKSDGGLTSRRGDPSPPSSNLPSLFSLLSLSSLKHVIITITAAETVSITETETVCAPPSSLRPVIPQLTVV